MEVNRESRHKMREKAFILLFEKEFSKDADPDSIIQIYNENFGDLSDYSKKLFKNVIINQNEIDSLISSYLKKGWRIERLSKVSICLLRIAVYEILFEPSVPKSVAINEAVELAKEYSDKKESSFINGLLGNI